MTAATAAAGQKAIDLAASDEAALAAAVEGEEVDEAGAGEQHHGPSAAEAPELSTEAPASPYEAPGRY